MTMIERVARAIYEAHGYSYEGRTINELGQPYGEWRKTVAAAKAAIEAMREPTETMINSQGKSRPDLAPTERLGALAEKLNISVRLQAARTYSEMIDAALQESK